MTAREMARLSASMSVVLPQVVTILRTSAESDGQGGQTTTWEALDPVPCRFGPLGMSPSERAVADRFTSKEVYRVAFLPGTDVRLTDRLEMDGEIFSVESVRRPHGIEVERVAIVTPAAV